MKKLTLSLAAIALVGLYASTASAQCDFNIAPAKGLKGSMVRNFAPCPGTEHGPSNTETDGGTEACSPVTPAEVNGNATAYSYSAKGGCSVQTSAKLVKDCSALTDSAKVPLGLEAGPCHITYVKGKCKGILGTDGDTPIGAGDTGWSLATLSRATLNDDGNNDMTVIDFPVTFNFSEPKNGSMKLSSNSAEALIPLVNANNAELPTCTQIELVEVTIKDPLGLPFAKLGGATVP
ncbi:MAG: hypothetical protein ABR538_03885 [Candidatus Binatia bacterium]